MKYVLLPAEALDFPEMNTLHLDAFKNNEIRVYMWPDVSQEDKFNYQLRRIFTMSSLDGSRFVKAVDAENGCAKPYHHSPQ